MKTVNFDKTLFEVTEQYPELVPVLAEAGFAGVANEQMRKGHGRVMTIAKGCEHLGIDIQAVARVLEAKGFTVKNCAA